MIARVELTESCWPATWKMSVPKASSGGSSSIHARGRKSGRASISRASTGSAFRRTSSASASAAAARLRAGGSIAGSADRRGQLVARLLAAATDGGADATVLVVRGVPIALLGAGEAGDRTGFDDRL